MNYIPYLTIEYRALETREIRHLIFVTNDNGDKLYILQPKPIKPIGKKKKNPIFQDFEDNKTTETIEWLLKE